MLLGCKCLLNRWPKEKKMKYFFTILQLASFLSCIVLFLLLMFDSYEKFTNKMTNVGVRMKLIEVTEKYLPCVTFCPLQAFRKFGIFYREKHFLRETFTKEELLLRGEEYGFTEASVYDESIYSIK